MAKSTPSVFSRLLIALATFWRILVDPRFAAAVAELRAGGPSAVSDAPRPEPEGCKKTLQQHFAIEAVRSETEGDRVTLPEGFDSSILRLTGNVVGQPPFSGSLSHRGWRVTEIKLPKVAAGHDLSILAPAEVEL